MEEFGSVALAAEGGSGIDGLDDEVIGFIGILFEADCGELIFGGVAALVGEDLVAFPVVGEGEGEEFLSFLLKGVPTGLDEGFAFQVGGIAVVIGFQLVRIDLVDDATGGFGTVVEVFAGVIGFEDVFARDEGFEDVLGLFFDAGLVVRVFLGELEAAGDVIHRFEGGFVGTGSAVDDHRAEFVSGFWQGASFFSHILYIGI